MLLALWSAYEWVSVQPQSGPAVLIRRRRR